MRISDWSSDVCSSDLLRLGDALAAPFPDESFDLVFSCVTNHELQPGTIGAMMDECHRLLRPGGVVLHLEVPQRYAEMDLWGQVRGEIEASYNNEPNWKIGRASCREKVCRSV